MNLDPIIQRIKTNIAQFNIVGGSADLPSANEKLLNHPAAFVIPGTENAGPNQLASGAINQRVIIGFGVLLAARNVSDASGLAALTELESLRVSTKQTLLGWEPDTEFEPILYKGGRVLKLDDDAVVWWLDEFTTASFERTV